MLETTITVTNRLGLHARAAAKLVQTVQPFNSTIMLEHKARKVNAKSIMGVMMLAASQGTELVVSANGDDEQAAIDTITALFERKFDEGG